MLLRILRFVLAFYGLAQAAVFSLPSRFPGTKNRWLTLTFREGGTRTGGKPELQSGLALRGENAIFKKNS